MGKSDTFFTPSMTVVANFVTMNCLDDLGGVPDSETLKLILAP